MTRFLPCCKLSLSQGYGLKKILVQKNYFRTNVSIIFISENLYFNLIKWYCYMDIFIIFDNLMWNHQEMTKKWPRYEQEMTKKWPRNDQEMTKNWPRHDQVSDDHKMTVTEKEWEILSMTVTDR
jgi:hypothetical protein